MARADIDTDLLFGILALQVGLIEQANLLDALQRWSRDKTRRLAQILVDRGALAPEDRTMLEGLVGRHLEKHGGDAERSLAAVAAPPALVTGLRHLGDPDVEATLDRTPCLIDDRPPIRDAAEMALGADGDSDATTDWTSGLGQSGLGQSSSDGGRFRPLRPHARGGIGMVSVALDSELHREVALKEILAEQADNVASRARFLLEAEVTGQLEHPGVVPVYALGTNGQGRPFYAMRFIRGESLKEAIVGFHKSKAPRGERALALRQLLSRFVGVCDTMAYAHSRGVLHRDLKPSNIMLGPYGETLVVDWGLAKLVGRDDPSNKPSAEATLRPASASGSSETEAGSIVGTPAYMSPEQAEGRLELLGPLSDVYSLGATLYCLLTGRPPFEDEIIAVLRQVRRGDFPPPRQVEPQVPRSLEAVVLKAMALHPQDRYDSARELARDIERWLADEPVRAYREPPTDRMVRWARNHKPAVAALSVLIVSAMAALAVNDTMIRVEKDRTEQQRRLAVDNFQKADEQRRLAQRLSANLTIDRGLSLCEHGEVNRGLLWLAHAMEVAPSSDSDIQDAARATLAAWSRQLTSLKGILRHPNELVLGIAFRPGGQSILTISKAPRTPTLDLTLWDLASGKPMGPPRRFGDPQAWITGPDAPPDWSLDFYRDSLGDWVSPEGTTILVDDTEAEARLLDIATGKAIGRPIPHRERLMCAAFSPDGTRFLIGGQDRTARVFNAATGAPVGDPLTHEGWLTDAAFSPDGRTILTGSLDGTARLWDAATGRSLLPPLRHAKDVLRVAYSPDGKTVLTGGFDRTARLWDGTTGQPIGRPLAHPSPVLALAFSPDGKTVLTGSQDGTARLWDAATGEPIGGLLRHESLIGFVTFSPDGRTALTCGDDNSSRLWDASTGLARGSPLEHVGWVDHAAFRPDGTVLVTAGRDFEAQVWDTSTSLSAGTSFPEARPVSRAAFSPDGRTVAIGCGDGTTRLRDALTGRMIGEPMRQEDNVRAVAFDPDGHTVLTGSLDKSARLWDAQTGRPVGRPMQHPEPVQSAAFRPDGRIVVTGDYDGTARFWDVATCQTIGPTLSHSKGSRIEAVAYSPDGRIVITGSDDTTGRLWDGATGQPIGEPLKHQGSVRSASFRHDGKIVATGGWDKAVRFWDPATGQPAAPPLMLQSLISSVAYSPDDKSLLVGFTDQTARIWDPAAGKPISPPFVHKGPVFSAVFRSDGRAALTGSADGTARIWTVPVPADGTVERIKCWVEVLTRMELSPEGVVRVLSAEEWEARNQRLRDLGGPPTT